MAGDSSNQRSIVKYYSRESPGFCGYCKLSGGCERYGLNAYYLSVEDYQDLIDRGWRRCGHYCYKPKMDESCCPMYTIRCDAQNFRLSRSQKKKLKKFNQYIMTGEKMRTSANNVGENFVMSPSLAERKAEVISSEVVKIINSENVCKNEIVTDISTKFVSQESMVGDSIPMTQENMVGDSIPIAARAKSKSSEKAKQKRINRKLEKLKLKGFTEEEIDKKMVEKKRYPTVKSIEDIVQIPLPATTAHQLEVRLVRSSPKSEEFVKTFEAGFELYKRYQVSIHKDPPSHISRSSYSSFLVESPLVATGPYGSYHQQYWLDEKLIAVGVIDILPRCVSSVYLFYDPDFNFLGLGTYSALREIQLTRSFHKDYPGLRYYYMGFYIHSCPKMRYKGSYSPSYLLCPETYTWQEIGSCVPKLDAAKYSRLDPDSSIISVVDLDISEIFIINKKRLTRIGNLKQVTRALHDVIQEYIFLVGADCARRMVLNP